MRSHQRRDEPSGPSGASDATEGDEPLIRLGLRRHRRPRLADFDYQGEYAYHIVVVTNGRQHFLTGEFANAARDRLIGACNAQSFDLLAFTLMPDHVHLLIHGQRAGSDLLAFVKRFKQTTSYDFIQRTGERLWQQSFFDHVLRRDEDPIAVAQYIVDNPVRAQLVARYEDWPFTGGTLVAVQRTGRT